MKLLLSMKRMNLGENMFLFLRERAGRKLSRKRRKNGWNCLWRNIWPDTLIREWTEKKP